MIKRFLTVILLFFLVAAGVSYAQTSPVGVKIYSGYLHQIDPKSRPSFFGALFGGNSSAEDQVIQERQCSIEFKSPVSFSQQSVAVEPEMLTYFIKFVNPPVSSSDISTKAPNPFSKFMIKVYTKDEQEYYIDPYGEGKQVGIEEEHHLTDTYLIYLILGTEIDHLEVLSLDKKNQSRYVLDKIEVYDTH